MKTQWSKIGLLASLYLNYVLNGVSMLIVTQNQHHFGVLWDTPQNMVVQMLAMIGFGRLFGYYFFGFVSDRLSRQRLLTIGMAAYLIFFAVLPLTSAWQIGAAMIFLAGLGNSALDAATYPLLLEVTENSSSGAVLVKASISGGEFLLPLLVVTINRGHLWFGWSFVLAAVVVSINLLLLTRHRLPQPTASSTAVVGLSAAAYRYRNILVVCLMGYAFTSMAVMLHVLQWLTRYAKEVLAFSDQSSHLLMSSYSIGSIVGVLTVFLLVMSRKISDQRLLVVMAVIALGAFAWLTQARTVTAMMLAAALFGASAANGVMQTALNILLRLFPNHKGRCTGIYLSFTSMAAVIVPAVIPAIAKHSLVAAFQSNLVMLSVNMILVLGIASFSVKSRD